jgi:serine/threonine protein kinase
MAPEVLNLQQGDYFDALKADMYSMGVCIYLMLFKRFPVYREVTYPATMELFENLELLDSCPFDCDEAQWIGLSKELRMILIALLNKDPLQRPSSQQLVQSFFLPPVNESIEEMVFEEMQNRRSFYEQERYEKMYKDKSSVQPVANRAQTIYDHNGEEAKMKPTMNKSGSSTHTSNQS